MEFRREKKDGEILIDAGNAAAIKLQDVDRVSLKKLLKHDAILAMFPSRDANVGDVAADAGVAEDVIGTGGLFHPPGVEHREL